MNGETQRNKEGREREREKGRERERHKGQTDRDEHPEHNIHRRSEWMTDWGVWKECVAALTTGPMGPGGPALSTMQVQELGRDGHLASSLCGAWTHKHTEQW